MTRGTLGGWFASLFLAISLFSNPVWAEPQCDPAMDACKSSRDGYLMMCACLEGSKKDLNFAGLDLRRALFRKKGSIAMSPDLTGADLSGANIRNSEAIRQANLMHANLRGANLDGADLLGADHFTSAKLVGATFNSRTTLPSTITVHPDEVGTRTQYRRVGCDLGLTWDDHDPKTGLPENCDGAISQSEQFQGGVLDTKKLDGEPGQSPQRYLQPSQQDGDKHTAGYDQ